MIIYKRGNIFESRCAALVNPVNCEGYMGRGLAKQFAEQWPMMLREYKEECAAGGLKIGTLHITQVDHFHKPTYVINFPTKILWRESSKLSYIKQGLDRLIKEMKSLKITSIAIPALGCGLGNLNFEDVVCVVEEKFCKYPKLEIEFYLPTNEFDKIPPGEDYFNENRENSADCKSDA